MEKLSKKSLRTIITTSIFATLLSIKAFAEPDTVDPVAGLNNLSNIVWSMFTIIGGLVFLFGCVQFGLGLQSHDTQQRSTGLLCAAGGIVMVSAKFLLNAITGA